MFFCPIIEYFTFSCGKDSIRMRRIIPPLLARFMSILLIILQNKSIEDHQTSTTSFDMRLPQPIYTRLSPIHFLNIFLYKTSNSYSFQSSPPHCTKANRRKLSTKCYKNDFLKKFEITD